MSPAAPSRYACYNGRKVLTDTIICFKGVGVSGTNCAAQTVCCENDSFSKHLIYHTRDLTGSIVDGLIAIGCTPINIDL